MVLEADVAGGEPQCRAVPGVDLTRGIPGEPVVRLGRQRVPLQCPVEVRLQERHSGGRGDAFPAPFAEGGEAALVADVGFEFDEAADDEIGQ